MPVSTPPAYKTSVFTLASSLKHRLFCFPFQETFHLSWKIISTPLRAIEKIKSISAIISYPITQPITRKGRFCDHPFMCYLTQLSTAIE